MIDQFDESLASWAREVVKHENSGVKISFAAPTDGDEDLAVNLYLLEIADDPLRHSTGHPPIQPVLRYMVTTSAGDPKDAHDLLGRLFYEALKHPRLELNELKLEVELDVELEPIASQLWTAFGIAPRPSFIVCLDLPPEWPVPPLRKTTVVTRGATAETGGLVTFYGLVLGRQNTPVASARVEMIVLQDPPKEPEHLEEVPLTTDYTQLERATYTDRKGRFTLPGIQAAPAAKTLLVRARGREQIFIVRGTGTPDAPVEFRLNLKPEPE